MAGIFRRAGPAFRERWEGRIDAARLKVMAAIEACRTAVLGGHMYACEGCGREHPLFNSCRNRHCPTCQGMAANRWSEARAAELLPVPYFHVVFTLPKETAASASATAGSSSASCSRPWPRPCAPSPPIPGMGACASAAPPSFIPGIRGSASTPICTWVVPNAGFDVDPSWHFSACPFLNVLS